MLSISTNSLERGVLLIREYVKTLQPSPGVYRMFNEKDDVLYVGKAKNLKKRVISYSLPDRLPTRLKRMVSETIRMEFIVTHTEGEALLLEANMIKKLQPRYNVLLKDDKAFPHIAIFKDHDFPRLGKHRGVQTKTDEFFGPFASADSVNSALISLQKTFGIRSCSDSYFKDRKRPCLLYHIKRCSAPCTGKISAQDYSINLEEMREFLKGQGNKVQKMLSDKMHEASNRTDFETAAFFRDRIKALSQIQMIQDINTHYIEDADIFALVQHGGQTCVQIFFFRQGCNYGNIPYFPAHSESLEPADILESFIGQFYAGRIPPQTILVSHSSPEVLDLSPILSEIHGKKIKIMVPQRGGRARLVSRALENAKLAIDRRILEKTTQHKTLKELQTLFDLEKTPERIEIYDNSHLQGSNPYGVMVVAGTDGFIKQAYRKFAIKNKQNQPDFGGDDFEMMREVFRRRFARIEQEEWAIPDLILVDGGKGQVSATLEVLNKLGLEIPLVGVGKGPNRNAGEETFYRKGESPFQLPKNHPLLFFIQRLRDESHRFAIGTHRAGRTKNLTSSPLDQIPGIGGKRKKLLLQHFGSAKAVSQAGINDLLQIEGISSSIAKIIYNHFHEA